MFFTSFGKYLLLIKSVFKKPEKWRIYWNGILLEMDSIGVGSLTLVGIISTFIGAVMTMQIAFQLVSDLIPNAIIGQINRDSSILELSPTITDLVLAGKEIGRASCRERVCQYV